MAREFANTAGSPNIDYVTYSGVPAVAGLATCSVVARLSGDTDTPSFGTLFSATSPSFANDVGIQRDGVAGTISGMFRNSSSSQKCKFSFTFNGAMRSVIFTFDGGASPKCVGYLDGVAQALTSDVTNATIGSGQTAMLVGGVAGYRWNGRIAEAAIYNRVITPEEAAMRAAGYTTDHFPRGRIFCAPLIREVHDIVGGLTGTITGTTVSDHPRIYA